MIEQSWFHETSVKDLTYVLFVRSTCYTFLVLMLYYYQNSNIQNHSNIYDGVFLQK